MSVVGFDIGNSSSVVALAQKRGIDVLLNHEAKRETPSAVYFGEEQRCMGGVAASKQNMYPRNTVTHLKRLLGKTFSSPDVQADLKRFPFTVLEGQRGGCLVQVNYSNQTTTFTPEQLVAMYLVHLKQLVTKETNVGVTDCVVSVPAYFTERERHAMLDATRIAGVNCLRLMDDTAATALCYGIFKSDLPEENPVYVAFVDMGHTALQVTPARVLLLSGICRSVWSLSRRVSCKFCPAAGIAISAAETTTRPCSSTLGRNSSRKPSWMCITAPKRASDCGLAARR